MNFDNLQAQWPKPSKLNLRIKGIEREEFQLEIPIQSVINAALNPNEFLLVILKSKMIILC